MPKKTQITPEQEVLFKEAFDGGLTSVGKTHHAQLATLAERTGLSLEFVKRKISNMKRGPQKKMQKVHVSNIATGKSHFSGYNLFCKEVGSVHDDPAMRHKGWSEGWKALSDDERIRYTQEAKHLNQRPIEEMSTEDKVALANRIIANMRNAITLLSRTGVMAMFCCAQGATLHCHRTVKCEQAWKQMQAAVEGAFNDYSGNPEVLEQRTLKRDDLRKAYQTKLSEAYGRYMNCPPKRFPYTDYREGKLPFTIQGLPDSMSTLKEPARLGRKQLSDFISASIYFEASEPSSTPETVDAPHVPDITPVPSSTPSSVPLSMPSSLEETSSHSLQENNQAMTPIVDEGGNVVAHVTELTESGADDAIPNVSRKNDEAHGVEDAIPNLSSQNDDAHGAEDAIPNVSSQNDTAHGDAECNSLSGKKVKQAKRKGKKLCKAPSNGKKAKKAKDQVFTVEQIISSRSTEDGGVAYLVQWKGYGPSENSWEPAENILDSMLLHQFYTRPH